MNVEEIEHIKKQNPAPGGLQVGDEVIFTGSFGEESGTVKSVAEPVVVLEHKGRSLVRTDIKITHPTDPQTQQ